MKTILFSIVFLLVISSCSNNIKFDSKTWHTSDAIYEGKRIKMIPDLLKNCLNFGMNYSKIKKMLGESISKDSLTLKYIIEEKYGKIDPNGYIFLKLDFDKTKKLIQWNIIEIGYKE